MTATIKNLDKAPDTLTKEHIAHYAERGYIAFRDFLEPELVADIKEATGSTAPPSTSVSSDRMLAAAAEGEVHDERLWMAIAEATGARGNSTCLVGTPEQVAESCLEYYKMGIDGILLRGFHPKEDAAEYGRELIPRMREGAAAIDAERNRARAAE